MLQEKSVRLPYREFAIATKRLIAPHLDLLIANGVDSLEPLASSCIEFLFHHRILARQSWRAVEPYTSLAIKSALHRFDTLAGAETNLAIILEPVIESVEGLLDDYMPFRTMNVITVERSFGELVMINHGDYRTLKFLEEHPDWEPTLEEPEVLIQVLEKTTKSLL